MNIIYYYFHTGSKQEGPFTLEEILKQPIKAHTQVWKEGEPHWQEAITLADLNPLFIQPEKTIHPANETQAQKDAGMYINKQNTKPKSLLNSLRVLSALIFIGLFFFLGFSIIASKCTGRGSSYNQNTSAYTYEDKKNSVLDVERANATKFLKASGNYNPTLFGRKIKVHGYVENTATVANFKDINIKISYFSSTKSLINQEVFVLYDYVPAHSKKNFEWKINPPKGTKTLSWEAISAIPY